MILPVASLDHYSVAGYSRYVRSSMLEVLSQDYIRPRAPKACVERVVIARHALKNAALPFVTIVGLDIPSLLGGAVVTEQCFRGRHGPLVYRRLDKGDYPVVMGILMLVATAVVIFQYSDRFGLHLFDPRIRLS